MKIIDTRDMEKKIAELKAKEEQTLRGLTTNQRLIIDPWYCEQQGRK
jgi:hypothetical protein